MSQQKNEEVQRLIKDLRSGTLTGAGLRRAILLLGEIGSEKAVPHLIAKLTYNDPVVRENAVHALGNIKKKLLEKGERIGPNHPELYALNHISPNEHPKSFNQLLKLLKKGKNKYEKNWELEAKELMALERRLK